MGYVNRTTTRVSYRAGLGTLPMQSSELAIQELRRCMNELGFRGIQIGTHINGINLDDASLFPIFQEGRYSVSDPTSSALKLSLNCS